MHHQMVLKVWAEDAESAESEASMALDDSISTGNNTCGWDYGDVILITEDKLQSEHGVKSFKELEMTTRKGQTENMENLIGEVKSDLLLVLTPLFLTKDEAPLYINTEDDDLRKYLEQFLKHKKDINRPDTFEKIHQVITDIVVGIAQKITGRSMLMYRMEQIKKLQYCLDYPDEGDALQSHENPFAELPCDDKAGLKPFFFLLDRHF